jgi:Spy/CpxP family protein refolding chaperone
MVPLESQLEVRMAELKSLVVAENPNQGSIDKKIDEIGAIRIQIEKKRIGHHLAVRAILTPDQRVPFDRHFLKSRSSCSERMEGPMEEKLMKIRKMMHKGMPEHEEKMEMEMEKIEK